MPGSNQNSNYQWVPTTAKDNLCGFASFVPLIDSIIERPRDFYGAECNNAFSNRFIDLYAAELPQSQTRYDNDADAKADAVKNAFARIMQETPNHVGADTPFKLLMQMVCAEYIRSSIDTDDESEPELQDNMVHKLLAAHATQLREAYAAFAANVEQEVAMDANVAHEEKFAVKSAACVDGNFFTRFIAQFKPELLAELKQVYCAEIREPRNAYAARATDMIYIAKMLGCISVLTIQNIPIHDESQQSAANEPTVSEFALNPTGTIEMVVKNVGYHWQPASLDTNAEPQDEAT
ncbi:MAG TPA: hypothetical protein VLG38_01950, partial [Gammaproteobacteria bacterium]|nr:hypothetical protein [Gammaproteobacteria bacterium]